MNENLDEKLHNLHNHIPSPKKSSIQDTIMKVRKVVNETEEKGLTFWKFYFQQFGFIRKKVWLIQFLILLFCGFKLYYYDVSMEGISLISSISPLIFLTGITELSRTYTYGTMELELSTQYTLRQVMMSRISILGLMDILSITILSIIARNSTTLHPYAIFIYICVPFMVTCFGCLCILNKFKNKECNYYCFAFGALIMILVSMCNAYFPRLYMASSLWIWNVMFIIALVGVSIQVYKLINNCNKKYNYINSNEF